MNFKRQSDERERGRENEWDNSFRVGEIFSILTSYWTCCPNLPKTLGSKAKMGWDEALLESRYFRKDGDLDIESCLIRFCS